MLVDEAKINVSGGHGGPGKASFFKKGRGPDGGNGGRGGDVYFQATTDYFALNRYASKKVFEASAGEPGGSNRKSGLNAPDLVLPVPVGTDVIDNQTQEVFNLDTSGQKVLICKGGLGGQGNADRANARMTTPIKSQPGLPGRVRNLKLVLRLIANYGLVGLPNAGKSSLLNALTNASAKIADYPFTTLEPNLGVCGDKIIADIPGLIAGASQGKGLGFQFLKHIEKVPIILHCLAADSANPRADYETIRDELAKYNPELLNKPEILLITKSDIPHHFPMQGIEVSILDDKSLESLRAKIVENRF